MNTKNILAAVVVVLILGAGAWYYFSGHLTAPSGSAGATVATVNGEAITQTELTQAEVQAAQSAGATNATSTAVEAQYQSQALDSLISEKLLAQAAAKAGITASSTAVDSQLQSIKSQFGTDTVAYQQALTAQGITEDQLRSQISEGLAIQAYLDQTLNLSSITASEDEITAAYNQIASSTSGVPALSDVHDQVKQLVIQQKQQQLVNTLVSQLRASANVQVLIATSTQA